MNNAIFTSSQMIFIQVLIIPRHIKMAASRNRVVWDTVTANWYNEYIIKITANSSVITANLFIALLTNGLFMMLSFKISTAKT